MAQVKNFSLNGQFYYTEQILTLFDIIVYFNYNDSLLVLEHNSLISKKTKWKETLIQNQDIIEIVTIVGGG